MQAFEPHRQALESWSVKRSTKKSGRKQTTDWRASVVVIALSLSLTGCPGGWREKIISTYSPEPVAPDAMAMHHGYGVGPIIAPGYLVDGLLYVKLFSENMHDLAFRNPPDVDYSVGGLIAAADHNILLDTRSFTLLREGNEPVAVDRVVSTHERPLVTAYGHEPRTACGFWSGGFEVKDPVIPIPMFNNKEPWPPLNKDKSVLCLWLEFDVSTRDVPPQKQFQLRFTYYRGDVANEVTLYFYPLTYTIFEH